MKKIAFLSLLLLACFLAPQASAFDSTVVNPDGTVTFRYLNPNAQEVIVDVQFAGRNAMALDPATGVWSATLGPAAPDMYPYCFIVDGVSIMDPANPQYFPNEGFKNSLLEIPATDGSLLHSIRDVPHGNVDYISYYSDAIGGYNNALVYTPPTYADNPDRAYPVFYLISGTTDTEEVYYKVGRMNYILDNLLADGSAQEMIIVLPYGNPTKLMANATPQMMMRDLFGQDLHGSLMPYVEAHYRTIPDADHRAIGGFSRGGNQGLMQGLTNLDKFAYLCSYSSFTMTQLPGVFDNPDDTNSRIRLLWSGVGTDDFLYGTARDFTQFLDDKGITCVKVYTDDKFGHTWMNAKYFLGLTMPLLFNPEASAAAMAAAQPTKAKTGDEQEFTPGVMARLFPKPLVSPEFTPDGVTFRIKAENAERVMLVGEMLDQPLAMTRDNDGVWEATLADIPADVYLYHFEVDGMPVTDAQNMYINPSYGFKRSVLDVSATPDMLIERTPVQYRAEGADRRYAVVAPAGTDADTPVIALIAADGDNFESWYRVGAANLILDYMMAAGQAKPHVLVLSETPVPGASVTLRASDYPSWPARRAALRTALQ